MATHGSTHAPEEGQHVPHVVSAGTYFLVYVILLVLLVLTVVVSRFDLGALNIIVALLVAVAKTSLVILIFMGVKWASRLAWIWSVFGFIWLLVLFGTLGDYITREWVHLPMGW
ncbi:caa(3)-type oxidase, subunit IV [Chthonomonas calidirosea]|uniref:cytochrome C oxidase subunit IV family protein n=1 Tax=Chthonomonas calidirosea TaxID=454171 RepID=UPI0006DD42B2|nr:cytochrome C oxidase subunit IV family protein [Chthonomonas calidirosea]CEK14729.1 caa(3)-type oxidase, subunit IV [Chthonomonas calidirosea]